MSIFLSKKNPVYFIAEIGGNHEGDFAYAERLTDLALSSGADAVKFQIYSGDTLVSRVESPDRNAHFKKFELTKEQYLSLARRCEAGGASFLASVWDVGALDWIDAHLPFYKIGSGDVTAYPVLRAHARRGKPIVLSTGLCTLEDVAGAVGCIAAVDPEYVTGKKLALLQCTSMYPIPDSDANLNVMTTLREKFGLSVGYSDHTEGVDAVLSAITMGAEIIEAHFTDERAGKAFRDHKVSLTAEEIRDILAKARRIKTLQGSFEKKPTNSETSAGHVKSFRRAVYAAVAVRKGEVLNEKNLTVLRPESGIPASQFDKVLGMRATRDLQEHEVLQWEDLEKGK